MSIFQNGCMTEDERAIFNMGADEARRFNADPYRHLYQDVMKAETAEWRLSISYSDPDGETYLSVVFKNRWTRDGQCKRVEIGYGSSSEAITRAMQFMTKHPAPAPQCFVDY